MLAVSKSYKNLLKEFIHHPSYIDVLLSVRQQEKISLDKLKEKFSDENKLRSTLKFLQDVGLIKKDGNNYHFIDNNEYYNFDIFLRNFQLAKGIFYDQVRHKFEQKAFNIIILKDKLNETFENLNRYSRIASQFKSFYKKEDLYKDCYRIAFEEIFADALEIYEIEENGNLKMVASNYRESKEVFQTPEEKKNIENVIQLREPVIMNNPQLNSMREKKIFAIFPIIEDDKLINILLFGFDNRKTSMIKDNILELIDGFALNFRLTLKTVKMIKVLEDKVNEKTAQLKESIAKLKEINAEIDGKNKAKIKEIGIAANIQRTVVPDPKRIPKIGSINMGAVWVAMPMKMSESEKAKFNVKEVAGDFFNYYTISEDEVGFLIADASGHGIPAALLTMMASAAFSFNSRKGGTTADICARSNIEINKAIGDIGSYLTVFYIKINLKTLEAQYTNAGHHYAIVYKRRTNTIEHWNTEGMFIGSFAEAQYGYANAQLEPGDKIVMYTDGFDESRNKDGEFFGEERIDQFLLENKDLHCKDFAEKLYQAVDEFCDHAPGWDDRTVVVLDIGNPEVEDKDSENVLRENIITHINRKQFDLAEKEVGKYIQKYGENMEILLQLGEIYLLSNQLDKAEVTYLKASKKDSKDPKPYQGLAKVAYAKKEFEKSAHYTQEATKLASLSKKRK